MVAEAGKPAMAAERAMLQGGRLSHVACQAGRGVQRRPRLHICLLRRVRLCRKCMRSRLCLCVCLP